MASNYDKKIKTARQHKQLSQKELAKLINVSQQTIASWEVGRTEPKTDNFKALSEVLDQPISYFVDEDKKYITQEFIENYEVLSDADRVEVNEFIELLLKQKTEREKFINNKIKGL